MSHRYIGILYEDSKFNIARTIPYLGLYMIPITLFVNRKYIDEWYNEYKLNVSTILNNQVSTKTNYKQTYVIHLHITSTFLCEIVLSFKISVLTACAVLQRFPSARYPFGIYHANTYPICRPPNGKPTTRLYTNWNHVYGLCCYLCVAKTHI